MLVETASIRIMPSAKPRLAESTSLEAALGRATVPSTRRDLFARPMAQRRASATM